MITVLASSGQVDGPAVLQPGRPRQDATSSRGLGPRCDLPCPPADAWPERHGAV